MAGSKEIRNKIKSVQSTRKITKAMEMVSASKMKKAQDRMRASRPYVEKLFNIVLHVAKANTEYRHPFLVAAREREARRRHRRHDRQGPVRRPQHERPAAGAAGAQGLEGQGHRRRLRRDRQPGPGVPAADGRPRGRERRAAGRPAAPRPDGRAGEDADRRVHGRQRRRGARVLHELRQHDEAGAAPRPHHPDPAPVQDGDRRSAQGRHRRRRRGTTSTSPTRGRCSTA